MKSKIYFDPAASLLFFVPSFLEALFAYEHPKAFKFDLSDLNDKVWALTRPGIVTFQPTR